MLNTILTRHMLLNTYPLLPALIEGLGFIHAKVSVPVAKSTTILMVSSTPTEFLQIKNVFMLHFVRNDTDVTPLDNLKMESLHVSQTYLVEIAPAGSTTVSTSTVHVASVHWLSTVHGSTSAWDTAHATSGGSSSRHHVSVGGSSSTSAKVATAWEAASEGRRWQSATGRPTEASTGTRHWQNRAHLKISIMEEHGIQTFFATLNMFLPQVLGNFT